MVKGIKKRGTSGPDLFQGTQKRDIYFGEGGNDRLFGFGGQDDCNGGFGNDLVSGGDGDDSISGDAGNDNLIGGNGDDTIEGGAGKDRIRGDAGDDSIDGGSGNDRISGGAGDDNISGGSGNDALSGGDGNDFISGNTGNDLMLGGAGDDTLDWDDGDGNDVMSGGDGRDTIEVDGSVQRGDNFRLGLSGGKAFFERVRLDGQAIGQFNLTVDTAEVFDVDGKGGNDSFVVNDLTGAGVEVIEFEGGAGNDTLDGRNTSTRIVATGGDGDDLLIGGKGTIVGANNVTLGDTLTGGIGRDKFQFSTDPFAGGAVGQNVNRPDVITDYEIGVDQVAFDRQTFGLNQLSFAKGSVNALSGSSNLLVLEGGFANAGAAATAIRDNNNLTAGRGAFVYFNQTLGISRVVFSEDLANGGRFSVQANLTNLTNVANQANFTAADFSLA